MILSVQHCLTSRETKRACAPVHDAKMAWTASSHAWDLELPIRYACVSTNLNRVNIILMTSQKEQQAMFQYVLVLSTFKSNAQPTTPYVETKNWSLQEVPEQKMEKLNANATYL